MQAIDDLLKCYPVRGKAVLKALVDKLQMTREPFKAHTFQVSVPKIVWKFKLPDLALMELTSIVQGHPIIGTSSVGEIRKNGCETET